MTCAACGAALRPDAPWCGQCHAPAGSALAPQPSRFQPATEQVLIPVYSRWQKSDTSFGPVGRLAWTVAMALVAAMALFSQNPFAIGPLCFILVPLVLRSVWTKSRVR